MNVNRRKARGGMHCWVYRSAVKAGCSITRGRPVPGLTLRFIKKGSFKPALKHRGNVSHQDQDWKVIQQERSLITEGSGSGLLLETLRTSSRPAFSTIQHQGGQRCADDQTAG